MRPFLGVAWMLALFGLYSAQAGCSPITKPDLSDLTFDGSVESLYAAQTDADSPYRPAQYVQDSDSSWLEEIGDPASDTPRTSREGLPDEFLDMTLDQAVQRALQNTAVLRDLGATVLRFPTATASIYDPAIQAADPRFGVDAALSAFDARTISLVTVQQNDRPFNNAVFGGGAQLFTQDLTNFDFTLTKVNRLGTQFTVRSLTDHDHSNSPDNLFSHVWESQFEASITQPLLRGGGLVVNDIAGPLAELGLDTGQGVALARISNAIDLAEFEQDVREFVEDVESAYWQLYSAYADLDAAERGYEMATETWKVVKARFDNELPGGQADREAQAREQMLEFRERYLEALNGSTRTGTTGVLQAEAVLRRMLGMRPGQQVLIRPSQDPGMAPIEFDWVAVRTEALVKRVEVRQQRSQIRDRRLRVAAHENLTLPQLDAVALYRARGLGDDLAGGQNRFDSAWRELFNGDFQEWEFGMRLEVPFGRRREFAALRQTEWDLAREQAILAEMEHQIVHQVADAIRALVLAEETLVVSQQRVEAAREVVLAREAALEADTVSVDRLLEAQRRLTEAETEFNQRQVDYALSLRDMQLAKGTLLEFRGVQILGD